MGIYQGNWELFQQKEAARIAELDRISRMEFKAECILDEQAEEHEYNEFWSLS